MADIDWNKRVLVIDHDANDADRLAQFLTGKHYDVHNCAGLDYARSIHDGWRPHVLVLVPTEECERHHELEDLRRLYPRLPVVVLTDEQGPDVLLDVEAFAPTLAVCPTRGLGHIESAVAAATAL
jgi:DNA-binding NtrC family response regulator